MTKIFISEVGANEYGKFIITHGYLLLGSTILGNGYGLLSLKSSSLISEFDRNSFIKSLLSVSVNLLLFVLIILIANVHYLLDGELIFSIIFYTYSTYLLELIRSKCTGNTYIFLKDMIRNLVIILVVVSFNVSDSMYLITISSLCIFCTTLIYFLFLLYKLGLKESNNTQFISFYIKGGVISLTSGLQFIKSWVEIFMAGFFLNNSLVGLYSILQKLGQLVKLPLVTLNADIAKKITGVIANRQVTEKLKNDLKINKILGLLFGIGAFLFLPFYVSFYDYSITFSNIFLGTILIITNVVNVYFGPIGLFAQLSELRNYYFIITFLVIMLSIIIVTLFVSNLGIIILGMSCFIVGIIWNYSIHTIISKNYKIRL